MIETERFDPISVFDALRSGATVLDEDFDRIYPENVRRLSQIHWTSVCVAKRAAEILVKDGSTRVLDVGSGPGKFCLIGALTTPGHFYGIEQRDWLALCARRLAGENGVERVKFLAGDMAALDWKYFDAFYLFNPFNENVFPDSLKIDTSVELSERRYVEAIGTAQYLLHQRPIGTRVVTFHGFGGEMPPGYEIITEEPMATGCLRLWVKTRDAE